MQTNGSGLLVKTGLWSYPCTAARSRRQAALLSPMRLRRLPASLNPEALILGDARPQALISVVLSLFPIA
jgi:hypothetical protein